LIRFWISWWQPGEDYRPLTFPPNNHILGWWRSGERGEGESSLCAAVSAKDEDAAKRYVLKDWPEATDWRFCNVVASDYVPGDRFPLSDWMKPRFGVKT